MEVSKKIEIPSKIILKSHMFQVKTIGSTAKSVLSSVTRIPDDDNVNPWQFGFFTAYRF